MGLGLYVRANDVHESTMNCENGMSILSRRGLPSRKMLPEV